MVILPEIEKKEALEYIAKYCSQNSTPSDIFTFDGKVPEMKLKYSVVVTHFVKFNFSVLVEARPKNNSDANSFMDRFSSESCTVAFASTGCDRTIEEVFWPTESTDVDFILEDDNDPKIQSNQLVVGALNQCCSAFNVDNAQYPTDKLNVFIKEMIDLELSEHYSDFYYSVKDTDYYIIDDSYVADLLFFPYYEFTFYYEGTPYTLKLAAHNHASDSKGFFGGKKGVIKGPLPQFVKESGGLFAKLKARKERMNEKDEQKAHFLTNVGPDIVITY